MVVVIAALMNINDWSLEEAFAHVKSRRTIANMRRWGGIMPQWRALRTFSKERQSKDQRK